MTNKGGKKMFKIKKFSFHYILFLVLAIFSISLFVVLAWGFITSLKDVFEFRDNKLGFPSQWKWSNYMTVLNSFEVKIVTTTKIVYYGIVQMYINSFLYALGCALVTVLAHFLVAYAISFFKYKISIFLECLIVVCMGIPIIGADASMLVLMYDLGLYDTWIGMLAMKTSFLGVYTLVLIAALKGVPYSIKEAAEIDGANNFTIMTLIIFPLVKNIMGVIYLLYFISYWNDYQTPLLYLPTKPTMAYGVYYFNFSTVNKISAVPYKLCGAMFLFVPILILYVLFNKKLLVGNMTIGAAKE